MKKVAIIGGGAGGLMAAITAARNGANVTMFEHNDSVGKKILASGNGRCNISNTSLSENDYFGEHPEFVKTALETFGYARFEKFCRSIGLLLDAKEDGRVYPLSNEARSVVIALESCAHESGVQFVTSQHVASVNAADSLFEISTEDEVFGKYDCVLIATGSEAAPQLGSNDSGYRMAELFGHAILPTYPSLVQLHLQSSIHHKMAGVKSDAEVTLFVNGIKEQKTRGDILFTRYGISGFAILDISRHAAVALQSFSAVDISLNLLPSFDAQRLASQIGQMCSALPKHTVGTLLSGLLPVKTIHHLLDSAKIAVDTPCEEVNTKTVKKLVHRIQNWKFEVTDTHGFKHAEVSGGGISTEEINPQTMESKKIKGLYFAGEVIDIVGRRGGYNLHFAWASGYLAGKAMSS